jgi:hypothetical protein
MTPGQLTDSKMIGPTATAGDNRRCSNPLAAVMASARQSMENGVSQSPKQPTVDIEPTRDANLPQIVAVASLKIGLDGADVIGHLRQSMADALDIFTNVTDEEIENEAIRRLVNKDKFSQRTVSNNEIVENIELITFTDTMSIVSPEPTGVEERVWDFDKISDLELEAEITKRLLRGVQFRQLAAWFAQRNEAAALALPAPQMSDEDLAKFRAYAEAHPWNSDEQTYASSYIRTHFDRWLGNGLTLEIIGSVNAELVRSYKEEILHNPRKRVRALTQPHQLPTGSKRALSARLVSEMTPEELEIRRLQERQKKARYRTAQRKAATNACP